MVGPRMGWGLDICFMIPGRSHASLFDFYYMGLQVADLQTAPDLGLTFTQTNVIYHLGIYLGPILG
jgi:hypothetical protein